ncbi:MAG: hypothetical protein C0507_18195 [Cyanobacteria bacterium PR.3.49]|nr:hypothetical protein [Cyanobacteria bacterium PR.3.49]
MKPLSIYQKGLLVIFLPLSVNIVWTSMYWQSLSASSALISEAENRGRIIFLMSRSVELFNKCGILLFDFVKSSGNEAVKKKVEQESLDLVSTLEQLDKETPNESGTKSAVQRVRSSMSQVRTTLKVLADKPGFSQGDVVELNLPDQFLEIMKDAHNILTILDASDRSFSQTLDAQKEDLRRTHFIVFSGLILNIAVALSLALFFKMTVAKRIATLSQRTRAFMTEDLAPLSSISKDEFEVLEMELSQAKKTLNRADGFRRVYMNAVAQRLQASLSSCLNASRTLESDLGEAESNGKKYLQRLNASVSTCLSLIDDVLLLESLDIGNLRLNIEKTSCQELVNDAIELVSNLAMAKNISVENLGDKTEVSLDRARIKQVLVNLLANAIKFSQQDSVIQIKSEARAGNFVRISVIDSGPGISKQASSKLFQKFFQTAEGKSAGGTGLGLAIAKLIIEAHAGLIGVESREGEGSAFWIEIPVHAKIEASGQGQL